MAKPISVLSEEPFDYLFKIVVIGDCGTGKTSLVQRFKSGTYSDRYTNTIGVDFAMKTVVLDGKRIKVQFICFYFYLLAILQQNLLRSHVCTVCIYQLLLNARICFPSCRFGILLGRNVSGL